MALTRYGELRNQLFRESFPNLFAPAVLRDADSGYVPLPISERLAQCVWYDQRLTPPLQTTDGTPVTVVYPGWWNLEAGPDFRHATIRLGDTELTGDIEIHLRADDWRHHGHDRDPLYDNVILHVVLWEAGSTAQVKTRQARVLPQLVLQHHLDAPLEQLHDEIDLDAYPHDAPDHAGQCAAILQTLPANSLIGLLESAGDERFAGKSRKFSRWIHRVGTAQAFYEGWMEALGYKANKAAFRTLAQRLPAETPAATFFGVAGFLPITAARDAYTKRLWDRWWKDRPDFEEKVLPKEVWRLAGIRPANHPHRRLGAAIALLHRHGNLLEKVTGAIETDGDPGKLFQEIRDDYWSHHFTLGGKRQTTGSELIGAARVAEIIANIVLPFTAALDDDRLKAKAKARYAALKPAPSNAVLKLATRQLFEKSPKITTTRQQQGLMQIFEDFCLNDRSACRQCQFPELVRRWGRT